MPISKEELKKVAFLKTEVFKVPSWDNSEILMRELSIEEGVLYTTMISEGKPVEDAVKYALNCVMLEPTMFTDEELKQCSASGLKGFEEIFANIQVVGKTQEQKEKHFKKQQEEFIKKQAETLKTPKENLTEEQIEKK